MRIILLAGGRGTRISKEINDVPKCTLEIEKDLSLIRYTVELLIKNKIEVSIVVGFKKDVVIDQLKDLPVQVYYNPFYDVTNSIASMWFAKDFWTEDDILIMNADVYIEQDTIDLLVKEERCPMMLVDSRKILDGDYFFKYDSKEILHKYGKELPVSERTGEYIGIF
jgi:choline kinase